MSVVCLSTSWNVSSLRIAMIDHISGPDIIAKAACVGGSGNAAVGEVC